MSDTNKDVSEALNVNPEELLPVEVENVYPPKTKSTQYQEALEDRDHLYVVITKDKQFYVGTTAREPEERWKEHRGYGRYDGAKFLKEKQIASFVLVKANLKYGENIENKLTLQLKANHGIENCDGGKYAAGERVSADSKDRFGESENNFIYTTVLDGNTTTASESRENTTTASESRGYTTTAPEARQSESTSTSVSMGGIPNPVAKFAEFAVEIRVVLYIIGLMLSFILGLISAPFVL